MDVSTSAATLTRPRLAIQVITGLAAAFIVYQAWQQSRHSASTSRSRRGSSSARVPSSGLHRSNALRRSERSTRRQIEGALEDIEQEHGIESRQQLEAILERHFGRHDAITPTLNVPQVTDSDSPNAALHADENVDAPGSRPSAAAGHGEVEAETVAGEEHTMEDDWQDDPWSLPPPRSGQNIVGLLFRVSEDNARRNAYVHRGCMCNACGLLPIRGIRYRCANCADFDLCETCESQGLHIKTHVFYKVKVPAPPFGPKSMQPVWYPGDPDTALRNLPSSLIKHLARETGFERPDLEALWEQWTFIANTEWRDDPDELYLAADRKTFERYLVPSSGTKRTSPNLIHDRMFAFYDTNGDDLISFPEFLKGLSYKKGKERLERIFKGYDIDDDGYISRKDCLRIFRTYYVLYKHMHGDVLEGLDQQAMHNTDTQQLVTSRQPLSSYFGREGRVPEADHGRPMEGKVFHSNGDVFINDDKNGVVNESRPDVGNREEILSSLFNHAGDSEYGSRFYTPASEHVTSPSGDEVQHIYHEALLNPPQRVEELVSLLVGEPRNIQPGELDPDNPENEDESNDGEASEEDTSVEEEEIEVIRPSIEPNSAQRPSPSAILISADRINYSNVTSTPPAAILREASDERWTSRPPTESQLRAQHLRMEAHRKRVMDRKLRVTVRKKLFDRWKKRNFYLTEEEGITPPEGFDEEDDVLADMNATDGADSKEAQPPLSARSRSSSKVRFAEDTDDYEIRSNPSTSSRSVPERWGGMEIPDAEKDMGKEILYVVTQQAFNELLDVLFKEKEDLAVKAAATKEFREAFRDILDSFDPDQTQPSQQFQQQSENQLPARRVVVAEVDENKPAQDRALPELLAVSGYTIDESLAANGVEAQQEETQQTDNSDQGDVEDSEESLQSTSDEIVYRDPTMPQFRPNSDAGLSRFASSPSEADGITSRAAGKRPRPAKLKDLSDASLSNGEQGGTASSPSSPPKQRQQRPPHNALVEWKKLDAAEKEAKERGGWGRLNLQEFKDIWHREESGPHRLDYLGTWIDFCIP